MYSPLQRHVLMWHLLKTSAVNFNFYSIFVIHSINTESWQKAEGTFCPHGGQKKKSLSTKQKLFWSFFFLYYCIDLKCTGLLFKQIYLCHTDRDMPDIKYIYHPECCLFSTTLIIIELSQLASIFFLSCTLHPSINVFIFGGGVLFWLLFVAFPTFCFNERSRNNNNPAK